MKLKGALEIGINKRTPNKPGGIHVIRAKSSNLARLACSVVKS